MDDHSLLEGVVGDIAFDELADDRDGAYAEEYSDVLAAVDAVLPQGYVAGSGSGRSGTVPLTAPAVAGWKLWLSMVINLMNTIVGVGVLSMPYCFRSAGILVAIAMLFGVMLITERTLALLVEASVLAGTRTYSGLVERAFGRCGSLTTDVFIIVMNFGTCVAYIDVIGDVLCAWIGPKWRYLGLFLVSYCILLPIASIKTITALRFTSLLGICIYGGFAITVGVLYCVATSTGRGAAVTFLPAGEEWENGEGAKGSPAVLVSPESFLAAIPIQILAFAAHTVTLQMFAEYSDGQAQDDDGGEDEDGMMTGGGSSHPGMLGGMGEEGRMGGRVARRDGLVATMKSLNPAKRVGQFLVAVRVALCLCLVMYIGVGLFGYLTFGGETSGNIIQDYARDATRGDDDKILLMGEWVSIMIEAAFALSVCMTFPLLVFPLRDSLEILLIGKPIGPLLGALFATICGRSCPKVCRPEGTSSGGEMPPTTYLDAGDEHPHGEIRGCVVCDSVRISGEAAANIRFYVLTFGIITSALGVAILIPSVEMVFGLTGASMGLAICFLLPPLVYIKLSFSSKANLSVGTHAGSRRRLLFNRYMSIAVLALAVPFGAASLVATIVDAVASLANPAAVHCK